MITLGLVDSVDDNGVYVTMPGSRGVLRGPYRALSTVAAGTTVLVASTDDGEQVVVGPAPNGGGVISVTAFGAKGDGVTDDTAAIQSALDAAEVSGLTLLIPDGTYSTTAALTVGDNTSIIGSGTISAVIPGAITRALIVAGDNVVIDGITIDGNKAAYSGSTEWKHGIFISAGCSTVTVRNVITKSNKGDGIYVEGGATPATRITLENVTSTGNHRQGLTISGGRDVLVIGGSYTATSGTAPQAGIDIEPYFDDYVLDAVTILNVDLSDNAGPGLQIGMEAASVCQRGVTVIGGRITGNDTGVLLGRMREVTLESVLIESNAGVGIESLGAVTESLRILNCTVRLSGERGIYLHPDTNPMDVVMMGCRVIDNAVDGATEGVMFDTNGTVFTAHNRIGNESSGNQTYGLRTTSAITAETHIANMLDGNDTGEALYGGTAASRLVLGQGAVTVTGSRGGNAALASLLTQLASLGLITDSTT